MHPVFPMLATLVAFGDLLTPCAIRRNRNTEHLGCGRGDRSSTSDE
jgi:hypothetical protein